MARGGWLSRLIGRVQDAFRTQPPAPPPPPNPAQRVQGIPPPPEYRQEVFISADDAIRNRVKLTKVSFWQDTVNFGRSASDRMVDNSDAIPEMEEALREPSESNWSDLASMAAKAHHTLDRTGDAGDLEIYLPYSFLWYHYLGLNVQAT